MKQVLIRQGHVVVTEMPVPHCGERDVLVEARYSMISSGTESTTLQDSAPAGGASIWANRLRKLGEVGRMILERGASDTRTAVATRLEGPSHVSGYSLAGTVLQVGSRVQDLVPGQRVACAGAASAHHAEIVAVPRNLVVPVPDGLPLDQASCVTLGAIALQGVRQADTRLGEIVCVVGLGLIGQLTVSLLRAAGCRVIGVDLDPARVERARNLGLEVGLDTAGEELEATLRALSCGHGVDVAMLTAGTDSSELIRQAVRLIRRKGRVVVVGAVGMDLDRGPFYMKEAELRISCSYGPGRYDPSYEERGNDYPYPYVRWTENRNMAEFLRLATAGIVRLEPLLDRTFDINEADQAYAAVGGTGDSRPLGVLLRYPGSSLDDVTAPKARIEVVPRASPGMGLGVACVGPGEFARAVHLPNLAGLTPRATLRAVVGRSGNAARETARRFAAGYAATDLDEILGDADVAMVLICTRHDRHADQAIRALRAGKAVFLEKPAALDLAELDRLAEVVESSTCPFTVGFNRRFAPDILSLKARLAERSGPLVAHYRINAGALPADHWALGPEGGGRLVGEACHMIDLLRHLVDRPRVSHSLTTLAPPPGCGAPLGDNFTLTCRYTDGSVTTLVFTSLGHAAAGKERLECHWDGRTAVVDDFKRLTFHGTKRTGAERVAPDKGHRELLRRFVEHARGADATPVPWGEIFDVSRFTLELDRQARGQTPTEPDD